MKKRDIREGAWKTEGIDLNIKRILAGQAVLSCLFLFLLLTAPSGALWWGIFYCLAECAVVYGGFAWLSGCVNRALHTASDCVQRLIDGIPESVSAVSLITPTTLLPFFAYSTRYIAVHIPSGTATISEQSVISIVFIIAGNIDTFSVV